MQTQSKQGRRIFRRDFTKNYSKELEQDFDRLFTDIYWTLTKIAKKHGFSSERSRQIYNLLYDKKYNILLGERSKIKKEEALKRSNDPRHKVAEYKDGTTRKGAIGELLFFNACRKRKLKITIPCDTVVDFKINGFWVDVKYTTDKNNGNSYFCYASHSKKQINKTHFFACYNPLTRSFFIIPNKWYDKKDAHICIRKIRSKNKLAKNKYWEYNNAWYLLEQKII